MNTLKVYLDQSAASGLIERNSTSLSGLYSTLKDMQAVGAVEVWASPHNAVELAVWSDFDRRQAVSSALEHLTSGRRMLASHEFILLYEALGLIEKAWPGGKVNMPLLQEKAQDNQRMYAGFIAHMAALRDYDASRGADCIVRTKKLSQLRQLKLLVSARDTVDLLVSHPERTAQTESCFDKDHGNLTIADLDKEIATLEASLASVGRQQQVAQKLERHRDSIVETFTESFSLPAIAVAIGGFENLIALWDYRHICGKWDEIDSALAHVIQPAALPPDVVERFVSQRPSPNDYVQVCNAMFRRIVKLQWMPRIMLDFLCRELEKAFKAAEPPTEGLTIDVDHISALFCCDVFLTYDSKLCSCLKTWLGKNAEDIGLPDRHCLGHISELKRLVDAK